MVKLPNSATSYWMEFNQKPAYPQLSGDIKVDVAIIGAGIAGLTTGYLLKQAGLSVAIVEKGTISSGVSGHTTGKVTSQHGLIYDKLTRRLGAETASIYGQANQAAIDQIEEIILHEQIDCGWQRRDNYVFTTDESRLDEFRNEAKIAKSYGLPATFVKETDLSFEVAGAVKFSNQAHFHIRKYLVGLARAVDGNGSFIFENSHAINIRAGQPGHVRTPDGQIIAHHIVVATNVPTLPLLARGSYCAVEYPKQSYIVAGRLDHEFNGMYISPDDGHYSILPIEHDNEQLLLVGGREHIPLTRFNSEERYHDLAQYAQKYFGITDFKYKWNHRDYLGYDDMPLIGRLYPTSTSIYTATGFMKWGLTNGTVAGVLMSDLVLGHDNPWAKTFDPYRSSVFKAIPKVIGENIGLINTKS